MDSMSTSKVDDFVPQTPDSDYEELPFPDSSTSPELRSRDETRTSRYRNHGVTTSTSLPYSDIYKPSVPFEFIKRDVFIPNLPIEVQFDKVDRDISGNFLSPYVYTLKVQHGEFEWIISRRYINFLSLHNALKLFSAKLMIPIPTRTHRQRRSFRNEVKTIRHVPKFPMGREVLQFSDVKLRRRGEQLAEYLSAVLKGDLFRNHIEMLEFLELSHLSFVGDLGTKRKEGFVSKRGGGERVSVGCLAMMNLLRSICASWSKRWLILKDTFLAVVRPFDGLVREVILFDSRFDIDQGFYETGRPHGILISNQNRKLAVSASGSDQSDDWMEQIKLAIDGPGADFVIKNRYGSFAPVRKDVRARWFVDGASYFEAVADAMEAATEEIFIADWMLSPELHLKRPIDGNRWRLDKILQRKAEQGVMIFVLLYKEIELALGISSVYSRGRLRAAHRNIKVLRHPDHVQSFVYMWAHHEKIVVVDQTYAFLGGLDLCFGRWDDHAHRLTDFGKSNKVDDSLLFRRSSIVMAAALTGAFCKKNVVQEHVIDQFRPRTIAKPSRSDSTKCLNYVWPGKDYMNFIVKDFTDLHFPFVDLIDRKCQPRMPWHDIGVMVDGAAGRDVARHFIQRWNAVKQEKVQHDPSYPLLMPKSYVNFNPTMELGSSRVNCQVIRSASRWSSGIAEYEGSIGEAYKKVISEAKHFVYIENQFFISLVGVNNEVTNQVADALYRRILRAHRSKEVFRVYIVIPLLPAFEGEFGKETGVALQAVMHWNYESICRGVNSLHRRLLSEVGNPSSYLTFCGLRTHEETCGQLVSELIYVHSKVMIADDRVAIIGSANINDRSLRGDRDSEIAVIIDDVDTYESRLGGERIQVGRFVSSLRQHLFREHLGLLDNSSNGDVIDILDPVCEKFYKEVWLKTASINTDIYEKVFRCIPTDSIRTFAQLEQYTKGSEVPLCVSSPVEASRRLRDVCGNLVLIPLHFLCDEFLQPPIGRFVSWMPRSLWT